MEGSTDAGLSKTVKSVKRLFKNARPDGRSYKEAEKISEEKGGPRIRTIKKVVIGHLHSIFIDVTPRGEKEKRFVLQEDYPHITPPKEALKKEHREKHDSTELAKLALDRAVEIIEHIDKDQSWRKPRRIRAICLKEIEPYVHSILYLKKAGYSIPAPWEFEEFYKDYPKSYWKGILGSRDISGPISLPYMDSKYLLGKHLHVLTPVNAEHGDFVNPNMRQWQSYLRTVVTMLERELGDNAE